MTRYKREIKEEACKRAKAGIHLKQIQADLGPNPKAVMRYLKKQGFDYKVEKQVLNPKTVIQLNKEKNIAKKAKKKSLIPAVSSFDDEF